MEKAKRLVVLATLLILTTAMLPISNASDVSKTQTIPEIEDPTPGYWETSEYMIGSVAVGIILPESNGTIDPSTEDWTEAEEEEITNKINYALDWWTSQNPDANVSFVTEFNYRVPTSYELITHDFSDPLLVHAYVEILTYLGYPGSGPPTQNRDYINGLRERYNTDWAFTIKIIDASNDSDGRWADGHGASAALGGLSLQVPVKTTGSLNWRVAHELGHIFWATDEYKGKTYYSGYLNVPDVEGSSCLMDAAVGSWCLSGKPQGLEGTWGQVGWRDSDGDGIQDIVDTFPRIWLNSPEISPGRVNYIGVTAVTPHPNENLWLPKNPEGKRDVTINKIKSVMYRVDEGEWMNTTITPYKFMKLTKYPDVYTEKTTRAVVNFTFTAELEPRNHSLEVRAINTVGNEGYANTTIEVPELITDLNNDGIVNIRDITIVAMAFGSNIGDENWNIIADLNNDEVIDIRDITIVASEFGKST